MLASHGDIVDMSPTNDCKLDVSQYIGTSFYQKPGFHHRHRSPPDQQDAVKSYNKSLAFMRDCSNRNVKGNFKASWPATGFSYYHQFSNYIGRDHHYLQPENPHAHELPLSELAIHIQGSPIIRPNCRKKRGKSKALESPPSSDKDSECSSKENEEKLCSDVDKSSSDCGAVECGEYGQNDSSLPRIIKPRKRRKKDKKAAAQTETGVTLKPYAPLCYYKRDNMNSMKINNYNNKSSQNGNLKERKLSGVVVSLKQIRAREKEDKDVSIESVVKNITSCSLEEEVFHPDVRRTQSDGKAEEAGHRARRASSSSSSHPQLVQNKTHQRLVVADSLHLKKQRYSTGDMEDFEGPIPRPLLEQSKYQ